MPEACCDFRTYSAEFIDGARGNAVRFSDLDLDRGNPAAEQSLALVRELIVLAQELTGLDSSVFPAP